MPTSSFPDHEHVTVLLKSLQWLPIAQDEIKSLSMTSGVPRELDLLSLDSWSAAFLDTASKETVHRDCVLVHTLLSDRKSSSFPTTQVQHQAAMPLYKGKGEPLNVRTGEDQEKLSY